MRGLNMKNYKKCSLSELILIIKNNQFIKEERKLAEDELENKLKIGIVK